MVAIPSEVALEKANSSFFYLQKQHVAAQSIGEGQEVTDKGTELKVSQFLK